MTEKFGLVLEGGGVRGAFTAGALAWLNDHDIRLDYSAGISSGAMYLTCYMMKNKRTPYNIATNYACLPEAVGPKALLREGHYVAYNFLFDECLKKKEHFTIQPLKDENPAMEVGVYDLDEGKTVYLGPREIDDDMKILQGACALPIAAAVVECGGHHYLDGGITKMIPIERAIEKGCTKFLVITTKPASYQRKPGSPAVKILMKAAYGKWPQIAKDYDVRHLNYYKQIGIINEQVEKGNAVHVRPSKDFPVSRFHGDPETCKVLYKLGYDEMEARKDEILSFLAQK